jgi:hypothetical protein
MTSPEEFAGRFASLHVDRSGGCYRVRLAAPGAEPLVIGRTPNPAVARVLVDAARRFVAAAVRAAQEEDDEEFLTGMRETATGGIEGRLASLPG